MSAGIEDGVSATGISFEDMLGPDPIAQFDLVPVTGPAAVGVIGSLRKKGAEDTVLHVKHWHVLVEGDLEPRGRSGLQECFQLGKIQIIRSGHALQPETAQEVFGSQGIGDV